jgi:hypothetical protein
MCIIAVSAIVIYCFIVCRPRKTNVRFPFPFDANKRKFVVSVFRLHKINGSCPFPLVPFSVCGIPETWRHGDMETRKQGDKETWRHGETETWRYRDTEMWRHGDMETCNQCKHGDMDMVVSNGKRKPKRFSSIHLPFAHRANGSLSSASLLTKKQTEVIRFANG